MTDLGLIALSIGHRLSGVRGVEEHIAVERKAEVLLGGVAGVLLQAYTFT